MFIDQLIGETGKRIIISGVLTNYHITKPNGSYHVDMTLKEDPSVIFRGILRSDVAKGAFLAATKRDKNTHLVVDVHNDNYRVVSARLGDKRIYFG